MANTKVTGLKVVRNMTMGRYFSLCSEVTQSIVKSIGYFRDCLCFTASQLPKPRKFCC